MSTWVCWAVTFTKTPAWTWKQWIFYHWCWKLQKWKRIWKQRLSYNLTRNPSKIKHFVSRCICKYKDLQNRALREKCSYSEFFWSVFPCIWIEYSVSLRIQSECGKIRTKKTLNTDTFHAVVFRTLPNIYPGIIQSYWLWLWLLVSDTENAPIVAQETLQKILWFHAC